MKKWMIWFVALALLLGFGGVVLPPTYKVVRYTCNGCAYHCSLDERIDKAHEDLEQGVKKNREKFRKEVEKEAESQAN